jgi:hypothetical protein
MIVQEKPFFQSFSDKHFGPKEEVVYKLQLVQIDRERPQAGQFEKPLETQDGDSIIVYYYFDGNETLYVLSGHLVRKGEPGPAEKKAVQKYIQEILKEDDSG